MAEPNWLARSWLLRALYSGPTAQQAQAHAVLYSEGECTKRPPRRYAMHPTLLLRGYLLSTRSDQCERAALAPHCDATNSGSETGLSWVCTESTVAQASDSSGWGTTVTPTPFCAGLYCPAPAAYTANGPRYRQVPPKYLPADSGSYGLCSPVQLLC